MGAVRGAGVGEGQQRLCNRHIKAEKHTSLEMMSKSEINPG